MTQILFCSLNNDKGKNKLEVDIKELSNNQSEIVIRALSDGVTNIGQLSKDEIKSLDKAVKNGNLRVVTDFSFPSWKKKYVRSFEY